MTEDLNTFKLEEVFSSFAVKEGLLGTWIGSVCRLWGKACSGKSLESMGQKGHRVFSS